MTDAPAPASAPQGAQQPVEAVGVCTEPQQTPTPAAATPPAEEDLGVIFGHCELPDDGVDYSQPGIDQERLVDFDLPPEVVANDSTGEQIGGFKKAIVAAGIPGAMKTVLVQYAMPVLKSGQRFEMDGPEILKQLGPNHGKKIEAARRVVAEAEKGWPGLRQWLDDSGLGNDPRVINSLAARYQRRPSKR